MSRLNFNDDDAVAEWLRGMRTDLNQADGISRDMLRPKRYVEAMEAAGVPSTSPMATSRPPRGACKPEGDGGDDGPKGAA